MSFEVVQPVCQAAALEAACQRVAVSGHLGGGAQVDVDGHAAQHVGLGHQELGVGGDVELLGDEELGADAHGVAADQGDARDLADWIAVEQDVGALMQTADVFEDTVVVLFMSEDLDALQELDAQIEDDQCDDGEDGHLDVAGCVVGVLLFFVLAHYHEFFVMITFMLWIPVSVSTRKRYMPAGQSVVLIVRSYCPLGELLNVCCPHWLKAIML